MNTNEQTYSCDTMVALPSVTANGQVIFGKNSDRPQEEAQPLVMRRRAVHEGGEAGAQFVDIPQARETFRHVGSRPYWCVGYEHGFNEHQVVIGNEALPTRLPVAGEPRLIGMELVRFGLERATNASEAVEVITGLVSQFGQGKFENSAGVRTYDNSFIITDPKEAYIVEAVGYDWAVRKVTASGTISNVCTLGSVEDSVSPGAKQHAIEVGLFSSGLGEEFSFSRAFADVGQSASGIARQCRTETLMNGNAGRVDPQNVMRILSDHSDGKDPSEPFVEDVSGQLSVCLHRTEAEERGVSAASLVADLCATGERLPVYWCGLYSPCMTLFLPTFIEGDLPAALSIGDEAPSDESPWWTFYQLTQSGIAGGPRRRAEIRAAWAPLQAELMESAYEIAGRGRELTEGGSADRATYLLSGYMQENFTRMMDVARLLESEMARS